MLDYRFAGLVNLLVFREIMVVVSRADQEPVILVFVRFDRRIMDIHIPDDCAGYRFKKRRIQILNQIPAAVILEMLRIRILFQFIYGSDRCMLCPDRERNVRSLLEITPRLFLTHQFQLVEIVDAVRIILRAGTAAVLH